MTVAGQSCGCAEVVLAPGVREVVVAFKTHFDIGYTQLAREVVDRYRTTMIDKALEVCDAAAALPPEQRFVWTLPGWPMEQMLWPGQTPERRRRIDKAVADARKSAEAMAKAAGKSVEERQVHVLAEGEDHVAAMVGRLKESRDFCRDALGWMPRVTVPEPEGAFYLFPRIEGLTDSFAFCRRLLEETKVGLAPGVAFGAGGEGSVRICYAADRSILEPAMDRLAGFLRRPVLVFSWRLSGE